MARSLEDYPRPVQTAILAGTAILLGAVAAWYFVLPRYEACVNEGAAIRALQAQNAASVTFERQRPLYRKRVEEAQAQLDDLRSKVPDNADPAGLVRLVYSAESSSGVHVRSLAAQQPVSSGVYTELPAKLRVDGEYSGLVRFFDHVAKDARITNVSALTLTVAATAGPGAYTLAPGETVSADFVLSTYANPAPAADPAAAARAAKK